jgi:hypothetical protein
MSFGGQHNAVRTPLLRAVSDFRSSRQYARYHEPRCRLRDTRSPMRCWTTFDNVVEMIVRDARDDDGGNRHPPAAVKVLL